MLTLLQLELLDTGLIGSNGGTLDTNAIFLDGLGRVNCDLVFGLVTVFDTQVVVLEVNVEVTDHSAWHLISVSEGLTARSTVTS